MLDTNSPPIIERIRQNILTTIASITVGNGYFATLTVQAISRFGNSTADCIAVVEQAEEEILGEHDENGAVSQDTQVQKFLVWVNIQPPTTDKIDYDRRINLAVADVRKAMFVDEHRGNLALRTEKLKAELFTTGDGQVGGVMVPFNIHYRTRLDDPYNQ